MNFISDSFIEQLLCEDVPYFDLTTQALGLDSIPGQLTFSTVAPTVLCCTEEATAILKKAGAQVESMLLTGSELEAGVTFLTAIGNAGTLHLGWKAAQNLLEYACGVATQTRQLVQLATSVNPDVMLYTTRKSIPATKPIAVKAIVAGGAYPHRLGLSETVLIFEQHLNFLGGIKGFMQQLPVLKRRAKEKKILVEVKNITDALQLAETAIDGIQFDKVSVSQLLQVIPQL